MYATHSIAELAKKLSVSIHTVRVQLAENNVDVRSRGGPNYVKADFSDVTDDDIKTKGIRQIAREKGVSPTAAYKRLLYSKGKHLRPGPSAPPEGVILQPEDPVEES
jgi:transposase